MTAGNWVVPEKGPSHIGRDILHRLDEFPSEDSLFFFSPMVKNVLSSSGLDCFLPSPSTNCFWVIQIPYNCLSTLNRKVFIDRERGKPSLTPPLLAFFVFLMCFSSSVHGCFCSKAHKWHTHFMSY